MSELASLLVFNIALFAQAVIILFSILDPIGTVPILMTLTEDFPEKRKKIVRQSVVLATVILLLFAYLGYVVFQLLGITLNDFRIAGGIILFIVAVEHLRGRESAARKVEAEELAAFPIATPLLAGPGAISTVVLLANPPYGPLIVFGAIVVNAVLAFVILDRSDVVRRILGVDGSRALTRITALLIAAIGVAFVREGVIKILEGG